ncbi:MAG: S26 family signal peptidase, partial [Pseudomonadota bacterium]
RDNSTDSRALGFVGYVPHENLVGEAQVIFFSAKPDWSFFRFWQWPSKIRWSRFFDTVE